MNKRDRLIRWLLDGEWAEPLHGPGLGHSAEDLADAMIADGWVLIPDMERPTRD